uniref:Uncharacterized protein n=1 Tax=Anguilla anguilla TaxID=7936 RepID=A0A0E9PZE6_ANGAN
MILSLCDLVHQGYSTISSWAHINKNGEYGTNIFTKQCLNNTYWAFIQ